MPNIPFWVLNRHLLCIAFALAWKNLYAVLISGVEESGGGDTMAFSVAWLLEIQVEKVSMAAVWVGSEVTADVSDVVKPAVRQRAMASLA
jgi:hypothetical protein